MSICGVPPHNLHLKSWSRYCSLGTSISISESFFNGRKGLIRAISPRIVDVQVVARSSLLVKVTRITLEVKVGKNGLSFCRQQFPFFDVCYAMIINKTSQGQTLMTRVGLGLLSDVFCHGQLYVSLSRTTPARTYSVSCNRCQLRLRALHKTRDGSITSCFQRLHLSTSAA